jgi:hypothetical protein
MSIFERQPIWAGVSFFNANNKFFKNNYELR